MNKQQCHALITEEFSRFKDGESTQESRLALAFKLTDEYYEMWAWKSGELSAEDFAEEAQ